MKTVGGIVWSDEEHAFVREAALAVDRSFSQFARKVILEEAERVLKRAAPKRPVKLDVSTLTETQRKAIEKILRGEE